MKNCNALEQTERNTCISEWKAPRVLIKRHCFCIRKNLRYYYRFHSQYERRECLYVGTGYRRLTERSEKVTDASDEGTERDDRSESA